MLGELEPLPAVLRWEPDGIPVLRAWREDFVGEIQRRFEAFAGSCPDQATGQALIGRYRGLGDHERTQVLRNPVVVGVLAEDDRSPVALREIVEAVRDPIEPPNGELPLRPFDDDSFPDIDRGGTALRRPTAGELRAITSGLADAQRLLREGSRAAAALCDLFVAVIVVAGETDEPDVFTSGSFSSDIGLVLLGNAHLKARVPVLLAEAVLHEAIHAMLNAHELARPFVPDPEARERRLASPWTGGSIAVHSFVQACFVWYGLFHFLSAAASSHSTASLGDRLRLCARGFQGSALEERLRPVAGEIDAEVLALIRACTEVIQSEHG